MRAFWCLFGVLALAFNVKPVIALQDPQSEAYRVASIRARRVTAVLAKTITMDETSNGYLLAYALIPPDTETQRLVTCSISCREAPGLMMAKVKDKNDPQRQYSEIEIPLTEQSRGRPFHVDITYVLDLYQVGLQRGKLASAQIVGPAKVDSLATTTVDYKDAAFQRYLSDNDLRRRPKESSLFFAYRAFRTLSADLAGRTRPDALDVAPENWKASYLCRPDMRNPGCGMCSIQLAAILRANDIPARLLVGRWAKNTEGAYGQFHVRLDFFDPAVGGWVPLDPTFGMMAVRDGKDPDVNFGANNGDFIAMHLNSDVPPEGSNFQMPLHQFEILGYRGKDPFRPKITETWTVGVSR